MKLDLHELAKLPFGKAQKEIEKAELNNYDVKIAAVLDFTIDAKSEDDARSMAQKYIADGSIADFAPLIEAGILSIKSNKGETK